MLGEEEVLGVVVTLEAVEEGEEDSVWDVGREVEVADFGKLGGSEGADGGMGSGTGEEDGEGGEEGVWVVETMGRHGVGVGRRRRKGRRVEILL